MIAATTLADLLQDPQRVEEIQAEAIPGLLGDLEPLRAALWARMTSAPTSGNGQSTQEGDSLVDVTEAARRLGTSRDYLYRHSAKLPFTVRLGPRQLRFSSRGIERFIRHREGRR